MVYKQRRLDRNDEAEKSAKPAGSLRKAHRARSEVDRYTSSSRGRRTKVFRVDYSATSSTCGTSANNHSVVDTYPTIDHLPGLSNVNETRANHETGFEAHGYHLSPDTPLRHLQLPNPKHGHRIQSKNRLGDVETPRLYRAILARPLRPLETFADQPELMRLMRSYTNS